VRTRFCAVFLCSILFTAQPAKSDDAADRLLANSSLAGKSLQVLTARIVLTWQAPGKPLNRNVGSVTLMKPNYARVMLTGDYPLITLASDGKFLYMLPDPTKYTVTNAESHGKNIDTPWWALPVRFFFTQSVKPFGPDSPLWTSSRYVGTETTKGESYSVVEIMGNQPMAYVARLYFGTDKILHRSVVTFGQGKGAAVFTAELSNVRFARRLRFAQFKFKPPATATLDTGAESRMLALGDTAPNFTLLTPDGDRLALANIRLGKKATLVNFWYVACPPCREEFRLFQKLYTDLAAEGFAVVAINNVDDAAEIKSYAVKSGLTFPIVIGDRKTPGVLGSYHIESYPSSYLLDSEGKIVYRSVGVNEAGLLQALKKLGVQK
jgi:peroxiredoxin/outer membrane lipoprotein-sorting protein